MVRNVLGLDWIWERRQIERVLSEVVQEEYERIDFGFIENSSFYGDISKFTSHEKRGYRIRRGLLSWSSFSPETVQEAMVWSGKEEGGGSYWVPRNFDRWYSVLNVNEEQT